MKQEIAQQWAAALPNYKQCAGTLHNVADNFCCLGVLCDLAVKAKVIPEPKYFRERGVYHYANHDCTLPQEVRCWAGMHSSDGNLRVAVQTATMRQEGKSLMRCNDLGATFEEIAGVIATHWEQL